MEGPKKDIIRQDRAPGLALLDEALKEVVISSPEVLNKLADELEKELNTLDTDEAKETINEVIKAMRAAAMIVEKE